LTNNHGDETQYQGDRSAGIKIDRHGASYERSYQGQQGKQRRSISSWFRIGRRRGTAVIPIERFLV